MSTEDCWNVAEIPTKASFISKMSIVIEEVDESYFWLEFLVDEGLLKKELVKPLLKEANELNFLSITQRLGKKTIYGWALVKFATFSMAGKEGSSFFG